MGLWQYRVSYADWVVAWRRISHVWIPARTRVITAADTQRRLELLDDFERAAMGWLWASDADGRLIYLSESAIDKLGMTSDELLAQPLTSLFEPDPNNPDERSDRPFKFQLSMHNKLSDLTVRIIGSKASESKQSVWWSISGLPKLDANGDFLGYRGSAKDITIEYERKLVDSKLAEYDSLTGLANRHRMTKRLDATLGAYKAAKRSCALLMLDLDRFKQVNDTMGHQAGDEVLRLVAERLKRVIGDAGEIGRLGGDEFQVILPDFDDRGALGELAEKIINVVSQPYPIENKRAIIGTSVGVAIAPYDGIERDELVHSADLALYAAKNGGRGQFRFYSADLKDEAEERRLLMEDMREALASDQLELHYQPVVRTADNMVVCMEALMRWEHPERGFISPGTFIPMAEESNLINQLGEWALRQACKDALAWPDTVRVAVNVSALQFTNPGFPTVVTNALAQSQLDPTRLELELTESVFMGDSDTTEATFKTLKALGVRLAARRFRHRLFLAQLFAFRPVRQDQGRQKLRRQLYPKGPEQRQDHRRDHWPVERAGHGNHGRRGRGIRPARPRQIKRCDLYSGLDLFQGVEAGRDFGTHWQRYLQDRTQWPRPVPL